MRVVMLLPLKQGLKPFLPSAILYPLTPVVMLLPLKQGLKQSDSDYFVARVEVVMLLPLKQGLKPFAANSRPLHSWSCYATSIKTRIETSERQYKKGDNAKLLCYFH